MTGLKIAVVALAASLFVALGCCWRLRTQSQQMRGELARVEWCAGHVTYEALYACARGDVHLTGEP